MEILVLYYSKHGATHRLADAIAAGIESVQNTQARVRTVPDVSPDNCQTQASIPPEGPPYANANDLRECAGLALGSPTRFGNMAAALKHFIDSSSDIWMSGGLINKPGCVFTSTSSLHGGQETTLLSMALPLIHHGMIWCGLPYSETALLHTQSGGTPYGVSHHAGPDNNQPISDDEIQLAQAQGQRLAQLSHALQQLPAS